jgi:hypothetical protein
MFERIDYTKLNSRQQENYNFHKVASGLADCGYTSIRLSDDYGGADFLAVSVNGGDILKIQLKSRFLFAHKYVGKGLYIAFRSGTNVFVYPHDELLQVALPYIGNSASWNERGEYFWPQLPEWGRAALVPYKLP